MSDFAITHCPHCGTFSQVKDTSIYAWRFITIHNGFIPDTSKPIQAIEVYCKNCSKTISITPLLS